MCADTAAVDYRDTVFLPETAFPMRAGLPQREPDWLARWARIGVYDRLREAVGRILAVSDATMPDALSPAPAPRAARPPR